MQGFRFQTVEHSKHSHFFQRFSSVQTKFEGLIANIYNTLSSEMNCFFLNYFLNINVFIQVFVSRSQCVLKEWSEVFYKL